MKKIISVVIFTIALTGCNPIMGNHLRVLELGPSGQFNPFVPSVTGGCLADVGNLDGATITYDNGRCSITMTSKGVVPNGK